jgi:hypothetical protein
MDGTGARGDFSVMLAALRDFRATRLSQDNPSDRALARAAGVSPTTVGAWLRGDRFPQRFDEFLKLVRAVKASARARNIPVPDGLLDDERWLAAYQDEARRRASQVSEAVQREQAAKALAVLSPPGRPLAEVTDPFALEVHRPVKAESQDLPVLPAYVQRAHDARLAEIVRAARDGSSGIAVLVGGSSAGKTRACWEALGILRSPGIPIPWRLWHPIDPSCPEAALREIREVRPHTVVWLNESQFYLDPASAALGERVAARLRDLLRDPARAPVLVLATLWREYWNHLTWRPGPGQPDPHAHARALLTGGDISVPSAFTTVQLKELAKAADQRLVQAAGAQDGEITQFLAGAPQLLSRYNNAPPPAAALVNAAMDARRLGVGVAIPRSFLQASAPDYLTDTEWDSLAEDWLGQAFSYTTKPCNGTLGVLTRIRPRPGAAQAGDAYRLADYLDQHGRSARRGVSPPTEFWTAAEGLIAPGALGRLAEGATDRGLYCQAARLRKRATIQGDAEAAMLLAGWLLSLQPGDHRQLLWIADNVALYHSAVLHRLLSAFKNAGSTEAVSRLLARNPADYVSLDDARALWYLLIELRLCGAKQQVAALLARRPAAHVSLAHPGALAGLIRELGAEEESAILAARLAADPAANNVCAVTAVLADRHLDEVSRRTFKRQAFAMLARDPVAHFPLLDPRDLAELISSLMKLAELRIPGAAEQVDRLLARDPASQVIVNDVSAVWDLAYELGRAEARDQVATLVARCAAEHKDTRDPRKIADLLEMLGRYAGRERADDLIARQPAGFVALDAHQDVLYLLIALHRVGAEAQMDELLIRCASENVVFSNASAFASVMKELYEEKSSEHLKALLTCNPAEHASLDNLTAVSDLLEILWDIGEAEQARILADRAAAHGSLNSCDGARILLKTLRRIRADKQAELIISRMPAEGSFAAFSQQSGYKDKYRFGRALCVRIM